MFVSPAVSTGDGYASLLRYRSLLDVSPPKHFVGIWRFREIANHSAVFFLPNRYHLSRVLTPHRFRICG